MRHSQDDATPNRHSQTARATSLLISTLAFHVMVARGTLPADKWRTTELCMAQYKHLFGSTRIPVQGGADEFFQDTKATHVVVLAAGQVYWFHVISPDQSTVLPPETIADNLRAILHDAASLPPEAAEAQAVGALTGVGREEWAELRSKLALDPANAESLQRVDSALLVLNLDAESPSTLTEASQDFLGGVSVIDPDSDAQVGSCLNRWYDKTLQLIVCSNGMAGVNFQHSHVDGHTVLRYASDIITDSILRFAQSIRGGLPSILDSVQHGDIGLSPAPQKVVWRLDASDKLAIKQAEAQLGDLLNQVEVEALEFSSFGKRAIKAASMSPDAFVQVGIQLAYYRVYGTLHNTYETVMTKAFHHGRTEPVRALSPATEEFVKRFTDPDVPGASKLAALKAALSLHSKRTGVASRALGCERHLYTLKVLSEQAGREPPALFKGPGWQRLMDNVISTSNCGNPSLRLFGFGPVSQQAGFGIGYLIKDDGIQFCISSRRRQTARFVHLLQRSLGDMMALSQRSSAPAQIGSGGSVPLGSVSLSGPTTPIGRYSGSGVSTWGRARASSSHALRPASAQ